jgi:hypothetical protein
MNQRQDIFVQQAQAAASNFIQAANELAQLGKYWSEEFGAGMPNVIADADVASLGITQYKLSLLPVISQQLTNFLNNAATTPQNNGQFLRELANIF